MRRAAGLRQHGRAGRAAVWALLFGVSAALLLQAAANAWLLAQRPQIEARLAEATGGAARIGEARIVWQGWRPLLALRDVQLMMDEVGAPRLAVARARIGIAPEALLQGSVRPNRLQLAGSDIRLQEGTEGWRLGAGKGDGSFDFVALQRLAARFDEVTVRDVALRAKPLGSALPVEARLETLWLRPERGGWRLRAELQDARRSGRLSISGVISGQAETPEDWRHSWRFALDGSHDLATSFGRLWPRLPAPRLEGMRMRGELLSQGEGIAGGWLASLDLRAGRVAVDGKEAVLEQLQGALNARLAEGQLRVEVEQLSLGGTSQSEGLRLRYAPEAASGSLRARRLGMALLSPVMQAVGGERFPRMEGALREVRLDWGESEAVIDHVEARLSEVALRAPAYTLEGLSGRLAGDGDAGRLTLPGQALTATLPDHLFAPLRLDHAAGTLRWKRDADGMTSLRFEELALGIDSVRAEGGGSLRLPAEGPPELALDMALRAERVAHAKPFMPRRWKPELRDYLAQAIERARVPEGRLRFDAQLAPDFWKDPDTEFDIALQVADAAMRFHPEWPRAEAVQGDVRIDAKGLAIQADRARMAGLELRGVAVSIPDFREAVLRAQLQHRTTLEQWYAMLRASPLAARLAGLTEGTRGKGQAALDFALTLPLKDRAATRAEGSVTLDGAVLDVAAIDATFNDVRGRVHFVNGAVAAEVLDARLHGRSVSARLDTRDGVPYLMADTRVDLGSAESLARLLPGWLQRRLTGDTPLSLDLALAPVDGINPLQLEIDSRGLTADLPEPLALVPDPVRDPIRVDVQLAEGRVASMQLRLPGRLALRLDGERTQLHLGPGRMPDGEGAGLHVSGHADTLPLPQWMALGSEIAAAAGEREGVRIGGSPRASELTGLDLTTDALRVGAFAVPDIALQMDGDGEGRRLWVDGASRGELRISGDTRAHLEGRFERLRLRRAHAPSDREAAAGETGGAIQDQPASESLDPAQLPSADLLVGDLLLDDLRLGQLDLRLEATDGGLALSRLRLADGMLDLEASGVWQRPEAAPDAATRMALEADLRTGHVDPLLSALGYARTLAARDFHARADLRWSDVQRLAQLAGAEGELQVEATEGTLTAVEPGAGRMLGLFNFFALPRRLGLDFRDVTDGGLAFDRLGGSFRLGGGDARTDNLRLESPSLRVEVSGRVGLAARDYDQRIRIYPDVSGGMTIGGAVLGGPIGMGIALLARELFETPIEAATRIEYRLVGDWNDPQIIPENIATTQQEPKR